MHNTQEPAQLNTTQSFFMLSMTPVLSFNKKLYGS